MALPRSWLMGSKSASEQEWSNYQSTRKTITGLASSGKISETEAGQRLEDLERRAQGAYMAAGGTAGDHAWPIADLASQTADAQDKRMRAAPLPVMLITPEMMTPPPAGQSQ
jgi:hypothetical protein